MSEDESQPIKGEMVDIGQIGTFIYINVEKHDPPNDVRVVAFRIGVEEFKRINGGEWLAACVSDMIEQVEADIDSTCAEHPGSYL